jgi:hypothetical protein
MNQFFGYGVVRPSPQVAQFTSKSATFNVKAVTDSRLRKGITGIHFLLQAPATIAYRKIFGGRVEVNSPVNSPWVQIALNPVTKNFIPKKRNKSGSYN